MDTTRQDARISARSAPVGTPTRWMNPVAAADLDDDGQAEIAAVTTPHIGGTLAVYLQTGDQLLPIASATGFSNHVYGSTQLGLSTPLGGGALRAAGSAAERRSTAECTHQLAVRIQP